VSKSRLEAFSDGVIAVAITLLVLNIGVPEIDKPGSLADKLGHNWQEYGAYAISFVTIGIIWINHHAMIGRLREVDHSILMLNIALLMFIAVLPFATDLLATYLKAGHGQHLAAAVYAGAFLAMGITFGALNAHILLARSHLLSVDLPAITRRRILNRAVGGIFPYVLAVALAPVSPYATVGVCAAVGVFYATPAAGGAGAG
jgi:uncharacterized membrane protein